jgi:ATP-dependent DNA helicase RecQ
VLIKRLRDRPAADPIAPGAASNDTMPGTARWFGFAEFRPEPADDDGRPLQQSIVEAALRGEHLLGILPTGTGKSLCYQIPALSRFDKTGALTVVISPLVALMADQVAGLRSTWHRQLPAAINGLLSMPERADVLDRVRLGDIGILIISPEQLRNPRCARCWRSAKSAPGCSTRRTACRNGGRISARIIAMSGASSARKAGDQPMPPVLCLTATAKPDVVADILAHFRDKVGVELRCFNGGASRSQSRFLRRCRPAGGKVLAHPPDAGGRSAA